MKINKEIMLRFYSEDVKLQVRIAAAKQNISMNELLNNIIVQYLENNKGVA